WLSESEAGTNLELRQADGKLLRPLAPPAPRDIEVVHVDPKSGRTVFASGGDPTERRLYAVGREGGLHSRDKPDNALGLEILSDKNRLAPATFAKNQSVYVLTSTSATAMSESSVQNSTGFVGKLPSVAESPGFTPKVEFTKVGGEPGFYCAIVRPHGFDPK